MSFLNGAADCGPVNPLAQLSKVSGVDNSLQRDRFVSQGQASSSSLRQLPTASRSPPPQLAQQPSSSRSVSQPFDLSSLHNALGGPPLQHQQQRPGPAQGWGDDFRQFDAARARPGPDRSGLEELWSQARNSPGPQMQQPGFMGSASQADMAAAWESLRAQPPQAAAAYAHQHQHGFAPQPYMGMGGMMGGMGMGSSFMQYQPPPVASADKGKGREVSWDAAFESYAQASQPQTKGDVDEGRLKGTTDELEEAHKKAQEAGEGKADTTEVDALEAIWNSHHNQTDADLKSWEAEFSQFANGDVASAYEEMERDQAERYQDEFNIQGDSIGTTDEAGYPRLGPYAFEKSNQFLTSPDPLAQARQLEQSIGSLSDRALALEAALQSSSMVRDSLAEAAAWKELGDTQTQDEKEIAGMRALEESVRVYERVKEQAGGQLDREAAEGMGAALMSLAISYTNEAYDQASYLTLHRHLSLLHPAHAAPLPPTHSNLAGDNQQNPWKVHGLLTESYLKVAREQQQAGIVDPGVQMALGLLYYSNADYELSADCWGAALNVTPHDFLLWNRLGATLANGGRPEEAIDAYRQALALNPTFTRALYNLGVSCLNIGVYQEAAEHLLSALSMHQTDSNAGQTNSFLTKDEAVNQSNNLWSSLRRAFYAMDRPDLADKAVVGADLRQFEQEFEFR